MRRLHATIEARSLPLEPFRRLIEANRIDQRKARYETWDEVREYCTYSADPVGRLVLGVYGRLDEPALVEMSDAVCTGLQLVNFLQDPPRDFQLGRLPAAGGSQALCGRRGRARRPGLGRFRSLERFESERARALLSRGFPLARALGGRPGSSVALFARGGLAALGHSTVPTTTSSAGVRLPEHLRSDARTRGAVAPVGDGKRVFASAPDHPA